MCDVNVAFLGVTRDRSNAALVICLRLSVMGLFSGPVGNDKACLLFFLAVLLRVGDNEGRGGAVLALVRCSRPRRVAAVP